MNINHDGEQDEIRKLIYDMEHVIKNGNLDDFKDFIKRVHGVQNKDLLCTHYNSQEIDLISLTCIHNKKKILKFLLRESHILHYFTSENTTKEIKRREDAFFYAMCVNHFELIELLYNHWTGDLHWLGHKTDYNDFDVENLIHLYISLKAALERYEKRVLSKAFTKRKIDQNMLFNIQSLLALNIFQKDLYSKLNKLKENLKNIDNKSEDNMRLQETYALRNMILTLLNCYKEHTVTPESITQNSVFTEKKPVEFLDNIKDTSTIMKKTYLYVYFDVFFRMLDYNICLLILDNLHSLKLRLVMPEDLYQKLENKVYHFIYHVSSKWSLYMPKKIKLKTKKFSGKHNNIDCNFLLKYNLNRFETGLHIIYLERRDFEHTLYMFHDELQKRNIKENIRQDKIKLPNEEINCLMLQPELRDIYSLQRISQYIAELYSIDVTNKRGYGFLLIERVLQVVGEFLKSTDETIHLQPTTKALVEVEISVKVVNDLKKLRDLLCHAKDGELLKRIEIETNQIEILEAALIELKFIKKKIDDIINICRPLVTKALILNGLSLIESRKQKMPPVVSSEFFNAVKRVRLFSKTKPYCEFFWIDKSYPEEYAAEVTKLVDHTVQLELKLLLVTKNIRNHLARKFSTYKNAIIDSMQKIIEMKTNWKQIVYTLKNKNHSVTLLDHPNEIDDDRIKTYEKTIDLGNDNLTSIIRDNLLYSYGEMHWKFIVSLLEFIVLTAETKKFTRDELNQVRLELKSLNDCYQNNDMERNITDYLLTIEQNLYVTLNINPKTQCPNFVGIKQLTHKLNVRNFLTQEEKNYLIDSLKKIKINCKIKLCAKIDEMIDKILNDVAIPKKVFTNFSAIFNLDEKAQKNLMNLVMGYKRDPLLPSCMSKRIALLREITNSQTADQLVTQYKFDKTFRVLLEVIVFDIFAILACTKNNDIVKKSSKLLTEINLRNILVHGSPMLELVGNVLDSSDLPTELVSKALELIKEETSINALCTLIDINFNVTQINSNSLTPEQQVLINKFKTSSRWKDYMVFIPKLKKIKHI